MSDSFAKTQGLGAEDSGTVQLSQDENDTHDKNGELIEIYCYANRDVKTKPEAVQDTGDATEKRTLDDATEDSRGTAVPKVYLKEPEVVYRGEKKLAPMAIGIQTVEGTWTQVHGTLINGKRIFKGPLNWVWSGPTEPNNHDLMEILSCSREMRIERGTPSFEPADPAPSLLND